MAKVNLVLKTENRRWLKSAFLALTLTCTLLGFASKRLAGIVAGAGAQFLARYAIRYQVTPE